ncbi:MAG: DUF4968 domain-containing protein [Deltaproteobacteria bacterium]|nr:DUF4968 domain-containing protein [Deltaproteobacteria bacterium]
MLARLNYFIGAAVLVSGVLAARAGTSELPREAQNLRHLDVSGYELNGSTLTIATSGSLKIQLTAVHDDVVRVWVDQHGRFTKEPSLALVQESWPDQPIKVIDRGTYLQLLTAKVSVRIQKKAIGVDFYRADDVTPITLDDSSKSFEWGLGSTLSMYRRMEPSEHIYGLGQDNTEHMGTLDRRGTRRDLWTGQRINRGKVTADVPIPFMLSTGGQGGGYGLFFDNTYRTLFDLGKTNTELYSWQAAGGEAIYYFIYGPAFPHIVDRYTELTGRPSLPNLWTLGYMQSKCTFYTWDEIDDAMRTLRSREIPVDSMAIDFDWPEHLQNFRWASRWNGESTWRIRDYGRMGVKFMISQSGPMIRKDSSNYQDGLRNNIFATDGNGQTVTCGYYGGDLMDFTAPNMKSWLWPQISHLHRDGIKGWWLDLTEPEGEPAETVYQGGPAAKIHNAFSMITSKTYFDMLKAADPDTRVFILTRTGSAGIQRYGTAIWTGDIYSDYETFAAQVPALMNMGLSGMPLWSNDSGGFLEGYYRNSLEAHGKLYQRWMEFSAFVPMPRAHHVGLSLPTDFGPEVEASSRHYLQMRYRLMPYFYSYTWEAHRTGAPMIRPLVFQYQNDPNVYNLKDEFLFGRDLLVAPVVTENTNTRSVYLPHGNWFGYEDGHDYKGGQFYEINAPAGKIPLFVRSGAIIPMAPPMLSTDERSWDPLTIDVYPDGESTFTLYADDGKSEAFARRSDFTETYIHSVLKPMREVVLTIQNSNTRFVPHTYLSQIHLWSSPGGVSIDRFPLALLPSADELSKAEQGAYWAEASRTLYVKFKREGALQHQVRVTLNGEDLRRR